jgi:hypothetical protein
LSGLGAGVSGRIAAARSSGRLARFGIAFAITLVIGLLLGVLWSQIVDLPSYTIQEDFLANMGEAGLTDVFAIDAWYVGLGLVGGAMLGALVWWWFGDLGWPVAFIAAGAGSLAGFVCRATGELVGPGNLAERVASANVGDQVPIEFTSHVGVAVVVWAMAALLPVMIGSSLTRDKPPVAARATEGHGGDEPAGERAI